MKKNNKFIGLLTVLVLLAVPCISRAIPTPEPTEGLFYYGSDEKVPLETATDYLAVRLKLGVHTESFIDSVAGIMDEIPWRRADEFPMYNTVLFEIEKELPSALWLEFERILRDHPDVETLTPVFFAGEERYLVIVTDEFLVQFRSDISEEQIMKFNGRHQTEVVDKDPSEENIFTLKVTPNSERDALDMANLYHENDVTLWAAPNFLTEIRKLFNPDDTYFKEQWPLENTSQGTIPYVGIKGEDVEAVKSWDITTGNEDIVIAIIDDGVDYNHEDLKPNIFKNPGEIPNDGIDNDPISKDLKGKYVDDVSGWDFRYNDNDPIPSNFNKPFNESKYNDIHGTACAGIGAARLNNKLGVAGICGGCKILPIKIVGGKTESLFAPPKIIGNAIRYAANLADVLSCSWRAPDSPYITNAIIYAATKGRSGKGCVIFFGTGNENKPSISYPASRPEVIAVGASNSRGVRSYYSNYGPKLDIVAPSSGWTDIYTTDVSIPNRGYDGLDKKGLYTTGFGKTSAATPLAAGIAALVLSANPTLKKAEVQEILEETAEKIDKANAGYDTNGFSKEYGYGRVNAYEAVKEAKKRRLKGVDIHVRDHGKDAGDTPTSGGWYTSVDIKVDGPTNGNQTFTNFNQIKHESAVSGKSNNIYVQVHNRGEIAANKVKINLYWAYAGTGLPQLPAKFWSEYPKSPSNTTYWHPIEQSKTINDLVSGTPQYQVFKWNAPAIDPTKKNPDHHCLLVIIDSGQDSVFVKLRDVGTIVRNDNNITLKNVNVENTNKGKSFSKQFFVGNPTNEVITTALRLTAPRALEQGWTISLKGLEFNEHIVLEPGDQILVTMDVIIPELGQESEVLVIQERVDIGPSLSMGGIVYDFGPEPTKCIKFEDPPLGTIYHINDTFTDSDVTITAQPFQWSDGQWTTDGFVKIGNDGLAGISGQEVGINNVNLELDFDTRLTNLSFNFGEYGGNLNIEVNGDFMNFGNFADINATTIGGVDVSTINGFGNYTGRLELNGDITSFKIGGQELWIDHVCLQ